MGNYSFRNIFTKEPVVIASAIRSVLFVLVLLGILVLDAPQLAGIALALELVLGLFVRQSTTPVAEPTVPSGTTVTVETPAGQPNTTVTV